jgi:isopropylmalate/homocitrate/citramalate synthase
MALALPRQVQLVEVAPRDGLQNEPVDLQTSDKISFITRLASAGLTVIESTAFVSPKWVPKMADAGAVMAGLTRRPGVRYTALVPNLAGLERAIAAGVDGIAVFAAASETFSRKNINQSIEQSLEAYAAVCAAAREQGLPVRGYLSTCFGCPYEGEVAPERVATLAARLMELGVHQVALSDTIGIAHPGQVLEVVQQVTTRVPVGRLALHLHDTRGTGLANALAGLAAGITTFDSSAGGLGGCPYAPGATGNLATEDLLYMLDGLGIETGARLEGVVEASRFLEACLGRDLPSRVYRAERRKGDTCRPQTS